jgi:hypothetical protein
MLLIFRAPFERQAMRLRRVPSAEKVVIENDWGNGPHRQARERPTSLTP